MRTHYAHHKTDWGSIKTCCGVNIKVRGNITIDPLEVTCKNCQRSIKYKEDTKNLNSESEETKVEKSYVERQVEWIKKNNVKVGDTVRITRIAENFENGWQNSWEPGEMVPDNLLKVEVLFSDPEQADGILLSDGYYYPYFVLEKVTEPSSTLTEAEPKKIDLLTHLEEICGEGWVHTIVDNGENGHLIISEATWQDKPYLNLHTLDYEHTTLTTIVIDGVEAMAYLRDILNKQIQEYKGEVE